MQEIIVKYNGNISALGYPTEILNENYAILTVSEADIPSLNNYAEIEYLELPKTLSLFRLEYADYACVTMVQSERGDNLSGEGVVIAVIDSGIDYRHKDFRKEDGSSRIAFIWDQTQAGTPAEDFLYGTEYTNEQINKALEDPEPLSVVPHQDYVGHGTAIAGIVAGNGRDSDGLVTGIAPKAAIIAVKLGERDNERFARTTEIMRAVKYVYNKARSMNLPLAVNISYGTNDGAHDGNSLFEDYINDMSDKWKSVIIVASGNEGAAKHHFQYKLKQGESVDIAFMVDTGLKKLVLNLWKDFADSFTHEIIAPNGTTSGEVRHLTNPTIVHLAGTQLRVRYTQPSHYNKDNEVVLFFEPGNGKAEITRGLWTVRVWGQEVVDGKIDAWLPTTEEVSDKTAFLVPAPDMTLTLPSCAEKVITVGGYDTVSGGFAPFSGRGYTRSNIQIKPDLTAPAVNVRSCQPGGGYGQYTGTSMAAPFVTGCAALMMQWGIALGNDPYLYGQRVKAFLIKGAGRDTDINYPNNRWGYGRLCLKSSMDYLKEFSYAQNGIFTKGARI